MDGMIFRLPYHYRLSIKLHLRDGRRDASLRPSVRSFVSLSAVFVRGVHPMGERTAMLHRNLRGDEKFVIDQ